MSPIGIIAGSGFIKFASFQADACLEIQTPYGDPSAPLQQGRFGEQAVVVLPRHGSGHSLAPHQINYRANMWALKHAGVDRVVALSTVGGIGQRYAPGKIVIPDQIIDYTYRRGHTYFEDHEPVTHIEFTSPYCETLRRSLQEAAAQVGVSIIAKGTYAATQGPRLETAAEVARLDRDGAHIVGMTGMPEASLARELELCYAALALVVNYAAGRGQGVVTAKQIEQAYADGFDDLIQILAAAIVESEPSVHRSPAPIRPS